MAEIRFRVRGIRTSEDHDFIIRRLAALVSDRPNVTEKPTGYRYVLDETNDWWADFDKETGEYVLAHRHGPEERMTALKTVVDWLVAAA